MRFLASIQNLPLKTRKIIFWLTLIVLAVGLLWWRFSNLPERFDQINLPDIKMPQININGPEETKNQ